MTSNNTEGRILAIGAACVFTAGACYILLEDVVKTGNWTMEHGLTIVTLLGTIAVGHLAGTSRGLLAKVGFALLFVAGTTLTVYTSVGRQAELSDTKVLSAEATNAAIAGKQGDLAKGRLRLDQANAMVQKEMTGERCGQRCADWKLRATEVQANVSKIEADIKALGPQKSVAAKADKMAKVLALFGWPEAPAKAALMLIEPFAYSLFFETGSIICFGFGFAQRQRPARPVMVQPIPLTPELVQEPVKTLLEIDSPVIQALRIAGRPLSNRELAAAMQCSPGEASKRRRTVAGLVREERDGKMVRISLQ